MLAMFRPIAASVLGLLVLAAGAPVPSINPEPSCRSAAARAKPIGDIEVCMRLEQAARDELVKRWEAFNADDKATCIPLAAVRGGICVSLYMPTSPRPDHAHANRVAFRDIAKEALKQLVEAGTDKRRLEPLEQQFDHLGGLDDVDIQALDHIHKLQHKK